MIPIDKIIIVILWSLRYCAFTDVPTLSILLSLSLLLLSYVIQKSINYHSFSIDISIVRFRKIHCTACDAHIGSAPAQAHNMLEHPVLHTLLCAKCRKFYGDGTFEQGTPLIYVHMLYFISINW